MRGAWVIGLAAIGAVVAGLPVAEMAVAGEDGVGPVVVGPVVVGPVVVGESTATRAPPADAPAVLPRRVVGVASLVGRWAKADPAGRALIDDCRQAYLEIGKDGRIRLVDPRLPEVAVDAVMTLSGGDPARGIAFTTGAGAGAGAGAGMAAAGDLRLDPAETPRLDTLYLRLERPTPFGATFVRCR